MCEQSENRNNTRIIIFVRLRSIRNSRATKVTQYVRQRVYNGNFFDPRRDGEETIDVFPSGTESFGIEVISDRMFGHSSIC